MLVFILNVSAKEKFEIENAHFVLFKDGTEVDEEYWETLKPETVIIVLSDGDEWHTCAFILFERLHLQNCDVKFSQLCKGINLKKSYEFSKFQHIIC